MKLAIKAILKGAALGLAAVAVAIAVSSCVTSETTITSPDGTVTVTKTSGPDAASVSAASGIVGIAGRIIINGQK